MQFIQKTILLKLLFIVFFLQFDFTSLTEFYYYRVKNKKNKNSDTIRIINFAVFTKKN